MSFIHSYRVEGLHGLPWYAQTKSTVSNHSKASVCRVQSKTVYHQSIAACPMYLPAAYHTLQPVCQTYRAGQFVKRTKSSGHSIERPALRWRQHKPFLS